MDEKLSITRSQWLALPGEIRFRMRHAYGIPMNESAQVIDNTVISDGVSEDTIRNTFSVIRMRAHLQLTANDPRTCDELWALMLQQRNPEPNSTPSESVAAPAAPETKVEKKTRKSAKKPRST